MFAAHKELTSLLGRCAAVDVKSFDEPNLDQLRKDVVPSLAIYSVGSPEVFSCRIKQRTSTCAC